MLAVATPLVPPSSELIGSVTLTFGPTLVPVTFTVIEQFEAAAIAPPVNEIEPLAATAVTVPPGTSHDVLIVREIKQLGGKFA